MQSWFSSLSGDVLSIRYCCVPEYQREPSVDDMTLVGKKVPAQNATINSKMSESPYRSSRHAKDFESRQKPNYSGFLLRAAERGDSTLLLASLKNDEHLIEGQDPNGNTALHIAARKGHAHICEILCQVLNLSSSDCDCSRGARLGMRSPQTNKHSQEMKTAASRKSHSHRLIGVSIAAITCCKSAVNHRPPHRAKPSEMPLPSLFVSSPRSSAGPPCSRSTTPAALPSRRPPTPAEAASPWRSSATPRPAPSPAA